MIRSLITRSAVAVLMLAGGLNAQNMLSGPESIVFDSLNNRYLVSCWKTGSVIAIDSEGHQSLFAQLSGMVLGNCISGNTFYTSYGTSPGRVVGFDLMTGTQVLNVAISGSTQIDGMTTDTSGYLYVANINYSGTANRLYRVNLSTGDNELFAEAGMPGDPQDVIFDPVNNHLLVAGYEALSPIVAVSLPDGAVSNFVTASPGGFDGITIDRDGYVYASLYIPGLVYRWEPDGVAGTMISRDHRGPAGLDYNWRDEILAVPNVNGNTISYIPLGDPDADDIPWHQDNCPELYNPGQDDVDLDGIGDACDECVDSDDDGYGDPGIAGNTCPDDNCPEVSNADQGDLDADGVGNECDNCLLVYNPGQEDLNEDGIGDICEGCCEGRVGDANGLGGDEPTIGDVSVMIDAKFITGTCEGILNCFTEADVNQSGGMEADCDDITIGDISVLIDYLFITGPSLGLAECL